MDITDDVLPITVNRETRNEQTEMDKRVMSVLLRKIDLRLMPLLTLIFYFNYLDRINIGSKRTTIQIVEIKDVLLFFSKGIHVVLDL